MKPSPVLPSTPGVVFFDAVGTLIQPNPPAPTVYAQVGERFGSRLDETAIAVRFRDAFRRQEGIDRLGSWHTDEERELARWSAIVAETLADADDPEGCFQALYAHFARPDAWSMDPDAGLALRALARRGWRIGLASNFDSRLHGVVAGLPDLAPVQMLVVSSEVGWRKPAVEFFRAVGGKAETDLAQIYFVGDDRCNDYDGAQAAGLGAVLFDPRGQLQSAPVRRIQRFGDSLSQ